MNAVQNSMSALPQDQAQVSEAQRILDQQKYEQDKIQYEKDQKTYDEELLAYQAKQKEALDVKTKAEAKVKAEAEAKAKAEADAKAQADAKALALSKEREAIETSYQTAIASNPHPAYLGTTSGGKGGGHTVPKPNISYYNYNAAAEKSKKSSLAGIAIRESGIILKSVGGISRSASNVLQGKSVGGDRHVTYQVGIVRANQNVTSGLISPSQYTQQVAQITQTYNQANQQFSIQTAKTASTNLRSLTIQQDTQRAIASQSGSAIGTVNRSGIGSISQASQVSVVNVSKQNLDVATTNYNKTVKTLDAFKETAPSTPTKPQRLTQASLKAISKVGGVSASDVNKFSNAPPVAPNQPTQQLQREGKITVTTPDGKTRTFKDKETADRFVATGIRPEAFQQYTVTTPEKTRTFINESSANRFIKQYNEQGNPLGYTKSGDPIQGAPKATYSTIAPFGTLEYLLTQDKKAKAQEKYGGFQDELAKNIAIQARLSEGEKPDGVDLIPYYASYGLKPILDIPLSVSDIATGENSVKTPSLLGVVIDQAWNDGVGMYETFTGERKATFQKPQTYQGVNSLWEYVAEDPIRSLVQLPAELGVAKGIGETIKIVSPFIKAVAVRYGIESPFRVGSSVVEGVGAEATNLDYYRGIAFRNTPLIGQTKQILVDGTIKTKLVLGNPNKLGVPELGTKALKDRNLGEMALGYGLEKNIFYSEKALQQQVASGYINELSKLRAQATVGLEESAQKSTGDMFVGGVGSDSFKSITQAQGEFELRYAELIKRADNLDDLHGSIATVSQIEPDLVKQAGQVLKMGDIDYQLKLSKSQVANSPYKQGTVDYMNWESKTLDTMSVNAAKYFKSHFPKQQGETLAIEVKGNVGLWLTQQSGKKIKIAEFIRRGSQQFQENPLANMPGKKPTTILGYEFPDKTVRIMNYDLTTKTLTYQGLTQTKTMLSYQMFRPTASTKAIKTITESEAETMNIFNMRTDTTIKFKNIGGEGNENTLAYFQPESVLIRSEPGITVYHGTSPENATDILKRGFTFGKSQTSGEVGGVRTMFATPVKNEAYFGEGLEFTSASLGKGNTITTRTGENIGLKIELKKDVNIFDVNKSVNPQLDNDALRVLAKGEKADIIKNMGQGGTTGEIEILNSNAIRSITEVGGQGRKWVNKNLNDVVRHEEVVVERSPIRLESLMSNTERQAFPETAQGGMSRFQDQVIKHELIHKADPFLPEKSVLELEVDPLGLTKALESGGRYPVKKANSLDFGMLDTDARAMIYAAKGRWQKDPARRYWIGLQQGRNQISAGKTKLGDITIARAETVKSLYPEVDFGKPLMDERVQINILTKTGTVQSSSPPKIISSISQSSSSHTITSNVVKSIDIPNVSLRSEYQSPKSVQESISSVGSNKNLIVKQKSFTSVGSIQSTPKPISNTLMSIGSSPKRGRGGDITSIPNTKPTKDKPIMSIPNKKPTKDTPSITVPKKPKPEIPIIPTRKIPARPPSRSSPSISDLSHNTDPRARRIRPKGLRIEFKSKGKEKQGKDGKYVDFVGNSRTDSLVGLINRKTTIGGDKTSQKATDLGNKMRLNPKMSKVGSKKKRKKKRQTDEMGKMFNKSKGLKV